MQHLVPGKSIQAHFGEKDNLKGFSDNETALKLKAALMKVDALCCFFFFCHVFGFLMGQKKTDHRVFGFLMGQRKTDHRVGQNGKATGNHHEFYSYESEGHAFMNDMPGIAPLGGGDCWLPF